MSVSVGWRCRVRSGVQLLLLLCGLGPFFHSNGFAVPALPCTLGWQPSSSPSVAGYAVYYGLLESSETNRLDVGGAESVTLTNLVAGATYFFYVVAYSPERFESEPSNVIFYRTSALSPAVASANDNGTFRIRCLAAPGITCVIEYSESLCPPDWKFMKSVEADEYGLVSFVDADMESHPGRFYRVGIPNNPEPSLPGQQEGR